MESLGDILKGRGKEEKGKEEGKRGRNGKESQGKRENGEENKGNCKRGGGRKNLKWKGKGMKVSRAEDFFGGVGFCFDLVLLVTFLNH